jgi:hypothetical protein
MSEPSKSEKSLPREIVLILLGALISAATAFLTNSFNEKSELRRNNIEKKLTINDQLAKDLGLRLFATTEVYKNRRNKDSTLNSNLSKYRQSKEDWNIKFLSYQSLLNAYYGESILAEFRDSIYNPLVLLGQEAEYNKPDSSFTDKIADLRNKNISFISKIYTLAQQ